MAHAGAFLFCAEEYFVHKRIRDSPDDFTDLQLWLNSSSCTGALTEALTQNTSIQQVTLLIHESFGDTSTTTGTTSDLQRQNISNLFRVLGRLPQLQQLFLNTYRFPFVATLPIKAFSNLFEGAHQLIAFKLWRTDLYGCCQGDVDAWAHALAGTCVCLQEFRLIKCRLTEEHEEEAIRDDSGTFGTMDSILVALSTLPALQEVELSATKLSALGTLSSESLRQLLRGSRSLQSFSLMHFDLSEAAVISIAESLHVYHQQTGAPSIDTATQQNHRQSLPQRQRGSLKHVKLSGVGSTASMFRQPIRDAFRSALESNYLLETLFIFDEGNLRDEIRFYLKLNRLGRYQLLQQAPVITTQRGGRFQEWIEILVQVHDDLNCLFYFLHECPLLLSGG